MNRPAVVLLAQLGTMTDADVFELQREIAREAQKRRQRDPVYQANRAMGVVAAQARHTR